ncbi:MAG TPA: hypothetical protein VK419_01340 [Bryobacteraceae bacterium]|nr:hypothetical protein [Bryobacteraceae bacterium]
MLLTDGNPNDTVDLQTYESAILNVASTEGIDVDVKLSLATEEISETVVDILLDHTRSVDPISNIRRTIGVSDVVVTSQMKRWHALHTLAVIYRDAFNNQLNDRYQQKLKEYRELSRNAKENTVKFGIGLALNPIPQAQTPALSSTSGTIPATLYYVQASWVSATGQEGAPSELTTFETPAASAMVVAGVNPPSNATGLNVYVGLTDDSVKLQTATPIPVGQSFTLPGPGLAAGRAPGTGQAPDIYVTGGQTLRRG